MANTSSRYHAEPDECFELENHFILRLPPEDAKTVTTLLEENKLKDKLQINMESDMRTAKVKVGSKQLNARLFDLPCIIETLKTVDNKTFYKSADIAQVLVCKENEDEPFSEVEVDPKKREKQFQWPHGVTPPLKNVRKRRFRKTLRKKYMDAPELERELKRLLRTDFDAINSTWEIVSIQEDTKHEKTADTITSATVPESKEGASPRSNAGEQDLKSINEDDIFGEAVSSSSSDSEDEASTADTGFQGNLETEESNSSDDVRSRIHQLQSAIVKCIKQKEHYEGELMLLDNPVLKERLEEEIRLKMEKKAELEEKLESLRSFMKQ